MKLSNEEVEKVAYLARMELTDAEIETLAGDLSDIIGFVEKINALNTKEIKPTAHVLDVENVMREDEIKPYNNTEALVKLSPLNNGEYFIVPKVIDK